MADPTTPATLAETAELFHQLAREYGDLLQSPLTEEDQPLDLAAWLATIEDAHTELWECWLALQQQFFRLLGEEVNDTDKNGAPRGAVTRFAPVDRVSLGVDRAHSDQNRRGLPGAPSRRVGTARRS